MSRFLYFVPGGQMAPSTQRRSELGLDDRITAVSFRGVRANSPSGGPGVVFSQKTKDGTAPMMDMKSQQWRPASKGTEKSPPYWIGYTKADHPRPETLQRDVMQSGSDYKTEGGQTWRIPIIRQWFDTGEIMPAWYTNFPRMLDFDPITGAPIEGRVVPRYESIWDYSLDLHMRLYFSSDDKRLLTDEELYRFAAMVININYHVSLFELSMLNSLSTADCVGIARIALDCDGYETALGNASSRLTQDDGNSLFGVDRLTTDNQAITSPA